MVFLGSGYRAAFGRLDVAVSSLLRRGRKSETSSIDHSAAALLALPGCPLCNELTEFERIHFFWLLRENYQQISVLNEISGALGFCPQHAVYLSTCSESVSSLSYIHSFVVADLLHSLSVGTSKKDDGAGLFAPARCYTCRSRDDQIRRNGFFVARLLAHPEAWTLYGEPGMLCAPHLSAVTPRLPLSRLDPFIDLHRNRITEARKAIVTNSGESNQPEVLAHAMRLTVGQESNLARPTSETLSDDGSADESDAILRLLANLRRSEECPICREQRRARAEWLRWLCTHGEHHGDPTNLLPTCAEHVWELVRVGSADVARLIVLRSCDRAAEKLHHIMAALRNPPPPPRSCIGRIVAPLFDTSRRRLAAAHRSLSYESACPLCYRLETAEERSLALFLRLLEQRRGVNLYELGPGLCVKHFARALRGSTSVRITDLLVAIEHAKLSLLAWEIEEYQRKVAWQCRPEARGGENTVWRRALLKVSGSAAFPLRPCGP